MQLTKSDYCQPVNPKTSSDEWKNEKASETAKLMGFERHQKVLSCPLSP